MSDDPDFVMSIPTTFFEDNNVLELFVRHVVDQIVSFRKYGDEDLVIFYMRSLLEVCKELRRIDADSPF